MLQRAIESRADHRPARLARLGLSAVRAITDLGLGDDETGPPDATLCFTNLESFTEFTALEGDTRPRSLLDEYYRVAGRIVRTWNGSTVKHIGDGLCCASPIPPTPSAPPSTLSNAHRSRCGSGRACTGARCWWITVTCSVTPSTWLLCVADAADGGQVMISADVFDVMEATSGLEFGRLKRHRFKGVAERMAACEVRRAPPSSAEPVS